MTEDALQAALRDIEDEVYCRSKNSTSISTEELGELVLQHLFQLDKVAYIRFASVYKKFNSVDEFVKEIEKLSGKA